MGVFDDEFKPASDRVMRSCLATVQLLERLPPAVGSAGEIT